jgi:hypothetical protein
MNIYMNFIFSTNKPGIGGTYVGTSSVPLLNPLPPRSQISTNTRDRRYVRRYVVRFFVESSTATFSDVIYIYINLYAERVVAS